MNLGRFFRFGLFSLLLQDWRNYYKFIITDFGIFLENGVKNLKGYYIDWISLLSKIIKDEPKDYKAYNNLQIVNKRMHQIQTLL